MYSKRSQTSQWNSNCRPPQDETAEAKLELTNETEEDLAVKVKCTDNDFFTIRVPLDMTYPSAAITKLEKGKSCVVSVKFNKRTFFEQSERKRNGHRFAIFHLPMGAEQDPRKVPWAPKGIRDDKSLEPQKRIPILVTIQETLSKAPSSTQAAKAPSSTQVKKEASKIPSKES